MPLGRAPSPVATSLGRARASGATPPRRLAPLTAATALTAAAVWGLLDPRSAGSGGAQVALVLAVVFVLTESTQLHLEFRTQTVSVSLSELPLVLGLFLVAPLPLLAARVTGYLVVALRRRTAPYKVGFNTALVTLDVALLEAVFAQAQLRHGPSAWAWAYLAVLVGTTCSGLIVLAGVARLQSGLTRPDVRSALSPVLVCGLLNTSLALIVLIVLDSDPRGLGLLLVVVVALTAAYRAYAVLLRRHQSLEQMHEFALDVSTARSGEELLQTVLHHSRRLLSAETALLVLPAVDDTGPPRVLVLSGDPPARVASAAEAAAALRLARGGAAGEDPAALLPDALCAPLALEGRSDAALLVAGRLGAMSSFTGADARLLALVASHLSVALQNSLLVVQLRQEATHDALTGLPNRALFAERLAATTTAPGAGRAAVLLMDLDGFKDVNDTLGHASGDALLREVARRLADAAPAGVTVARLGGDEFALLVPLREAAGAREVAARLQAAVQRPFGVEGVEVDVRASLGIALFPEHGVDGTDLLQRADVAMYAAKEARVPVEVYDAEADRSSPRRLALVGELRTAVTDGALVVHYQPKVDLRSGEVTGVEALVRWPHPALGLVPPDDFIGVAERTGLILDLTRIVLDQALGQCARWSARGLHLSVAVNVSPRALLAPGFAEDVLARLARHGVAPALLTLEVTETSVMTDPEAAITVLAGLRDRGVHLSVDDFGTGYSSLAYLQRLGVDEVKIDKSFVMTLATDTGNAAIVRAIVDLGHSLGLTVVAEGLEDECSRALLGELGCDTAQGYLLSRPLPVAALDPWLAGAQARRTPPQAGAGPVRLLRAVEPGDRHRRRAGGGTARR